MIVGVWSFRGELHSRSAIELQFFREVWIEVQAFNFSYAPLWNYISLRVRLMKTVLLGGDYASLNFACCRNSVWCGGLQHSRRLCVTIEGRSFCTLEFRSAKFWRTRWASEVWFLCSGSNAGSNTFYFKMQTRLFRLKHKSHLRQDLWACRVVNWCVHIGFSYTQSPPLSYTVGGQKPGHRAFIMLSS